MKVPRLSPRSYCSACGRVFYSDKRYPCRCGATARTFDRRIDDQMVSTDQVS